MWNPSENSLNSKNFNKLSWIEWNPLQNYVKFSQKLDEIFLTIQSSFLKNWNSIKSCVKFA